MNKLIVLVAFVTFLCGQNLFGQIHQSSLKEYSEKEANEWGLKLNLSNYKTQKLAEILFDYKFKEGQAVLNKVVDFKEAQKENMREKEKAIQKLFSKQEYKTFQLFNEYSNIDRVNHLSNLIEEYSKKEELVTSIVNYREQYILPVLRVHRGELESKISKADKESLDVLRVELYETLDKCIIDCKKDGASESQQHKTLEELLFKEISVQVSDKMSPMNHLLQLTKKYEEEIDEEKSHFNNETGKWNADMEAIHKEFILENHLAAFRKTLESNSVVAWKQIRFNAFFLLLDPSTEEEAKKILKLGLIMLPQLEI